MATYRTRVAGQDRILTAIVDSAKQEPRDDVRAVMIEIATQLAVRWGVKDVPGLPGTATPAADTKAA